MVIEKSIKPITYLSPQQESFVIDVFNDVKPGRAYANHYQVKSLAVAGAAATRLLKTVKILARLRELQAKAESDAVGTVLERKQRLTEIYRANLTDFIDKDGIITLKPTAALAEYEVTRHRRKVKLRDPVAAITEHNRMEKVYDTATLQNFNQQVIQFVIPEGGNLVEGMRERFKALNRNQGEDGDSD